LIANLILISGDLSEYYDQANGNRFEDAANAPLAK
jgi:hypothetical protein